MSERLFKRTLLIACLLFLTFFTLYGIHRASAISEPEHLIFQAKGESWNAVIHVRQVKERPLSYRVSEGYALTYIGQDLKRVEHQQKPVTWFVDSQLSDGRYAKHSSHFQSFIGTERDGATFETSAALQIFKDTDTYHVRIKWDGNREEQLTLTCIGME
ncbi:MULTISPECIES: hypothetical protein [Exiguobacterium]|uniref:hypothetical protein n=1 Tax=Exiguobacterium TaxID=33986 RepID=UPI000554E615|nr:MULTISPECIES: hypothetical protein [Exiguobacterium]NTY09292.1 hypothetical protein [Exiguobacterium sp. JMULE1]